MRLQELLIQLPGIELFIENIIDDCLDRKSVVVVVPPYLDALEIESLLRQRISEKLLHAEEILLPEMPDGEPPAAQLGTRFSVEWVSPNCPRTVTNLLDSSGLPECIFFSGFDLLKTEEKSLWLDFLNKWNRAPLSGANRGIQQKPALCFVLSGTDIYADPLNSAPQLSVRHWFGFPSALEVRLLCRIAEGQSGGHREKGRWREYLLPSLAESDVTLANNLWDKVFNSVDKLLHFFSKDAIERGWSKEVLLEWGIDKFMNAHRPDMDIGRVISSYPKLLANGAICRTLEYGTEIHTSALAALEEYGQLERRIWRGQVPLLITMVDNIRLFICDILTEKQGAGWPLFFPPKEPEEYNLVKLNPRACQLGHILYTIHNKASFMEEKKYLTLIQVTRSIRNELAHYRPVNYSDYHRMVSEAKKYGLLFL